MPQRGYKRWIASVPPPNTSPLIYVQGYYDSVLPIQSTRIPVIIDYQSAMTPNEELKQIEELKQLEDNFNESVWLLNQHIEPLIGDRSCHYLAEKYGIHRASCYTVFVQDNEDDTYGCRHERCRGFQVHSLEDAITHQRYHHFDHRPFECIPPNGSQW